MNTNKLERMIHDAIEEAIWEYEIQEDEEVANIDIDVNGHVEDSNISLFVDVYDHEEDD